MRAQQTWPAPNPAAAAMQRPHHPAHVLRLRALPHRQQQRRDLDDRPGSGMHTMGPDGLSSAAHTHTPFPVTPPTSTRQGCFTPEGRAAHAHGQHSVGLHGDWDAGRPERQHETEADVGLGPAGRSQGSMQRIESAQPATHHPGKARDGQRHPTTELESGRRWLVEIATKAAEGTRRLRRLDLTGSVDHQQCRRPKARARARRG